MSEATSPDANPSNPSRTIAYAVDAYTDFAQQALDSERQAFKQKYGDDADMSATTFVVRKVDLSTR